MDFHYISIKNRDTQIIELDRGAAAKGVLEIWQQLSDLRNTDPNTVLNRRLKRPTCYRRSCSIAALLIPSLKNRFPSAGRMILK
jgi:hypothetical protein